jgi:hypothetical protein
MTAMLGLIQQVTAELGVSTPTQVIGNSSQDIIQLLALMNASGYELLRKHDWRELTKQYTFQTQYLTTTGTWSTSSLQVTGIPSTATITTGYQLVGAGLPNATYVVSVDSSTTVTINQYPTIAGTAATVVFQQVKYALPSDYDAIVPRTMWDKTKRWELLGPESPQQWEWLLSGYISTGPRIRWRLLGTTFQIWPGMSYNEVLGFEYRSAGWAASASGTVKNSFTADTDTCIYPDRLMVLMTKLKYFEAKGFDTTAMYRNFSEELGTVMAQNQSGANLSFAPRPSTVLIGYENIPDSGYGT